MPGGDGTGPMGMGPRSGRAAGYCSGYAMPGFANLWPGRGFRGYARPGFWGYPAYAEDKEALKQEAESLKEQIKMLEARLEELSASKKEE